MNTYDYAVKANSGKDAKTAMIIRRTDGVVEEYTYSQTFEMTDRFAQILIECGITEGDRVAICAQSCPYWNVAFLAIAKLKATAVLIDYTLKGDEIKRLVDKGDVKLLFSTKKVMEKLGSLTDIPVLDIFNKAEYFENCPCRKSEKIVEDKNPNVGAIIFSSGTTKTASGIMHSHDSMIGSSIMCMSSNFLKPDIERFFGILPNSHIYGLYTQVIAPLCLSGTVYFLESITPNAMTSAFTEFKPTIIPGVPKVFDLLKDSIMKKINSEEKTAKLFAKFFPICLSVRQKTGVNLGKKLFSAVQNGFGGCVRVMSTAGAPISEQTAEFFYGTGFNFLLTYGATETSIPTIGNYGKNLTTNSTGKPYPDIDVKIADNGEILIKSPYMMMGYFRDDELTRDAFDENGWFKTGDLAEYNSQKNIIIKGRIKDNIVLSNGKKVAPDDIEAEYTGVENINEIVVCGIPKENGSCDEIHAFVVAEEVNKPTILSELKRKSAEASKYMKLKRIHFVDEIPKTTLMKPKRYLLKKMIDEEKKDTATQK